jgi:hypothetical protein
MEVTADRETKTGAVGQHHRTYQVIGRRQ